MSEKLLGLYLEMITVHPNAVVCSICYAFQNRLDYMHLLSRIVDPTDLSSTQQLLTIVSIHNTEWYWHKRLSSFSL